MLSRIEELIIQAQELEASPPKDQPLATAKKIYTTMIIELIKAINTNNIDRLWEKASYFQHCLAELITDQEEKIMWAKTAVESLLQISNIKRDINYWRLLAERQRRVGIILHTDSMHDHTKEIIDYFELAVSSFKNISENERTDDDWRKMKSCYRWIFSYQKNNSLKLIANQNALQCIQAIALTSRHQQDWHQIAKYQNDMGVIKNNQDRLYWYREASLSLEHIPEEVRVAKNWYLYFYCQYNIAISTDDVEAKNAYQAAINCFRYLAQNQRGEIEWYTLATCQKYLADEKNTEEEIRFNLYQDCIFSLSKIENKKDSHYRLMANCQNKLANLYIRNDKWSKAQHYFHCSLDTLINIKDKNKTDFNLIADNYDKLSKMEFTPSIAYELFTFAEKIFFSVTHHFDVKIKFLQLHLKISQNMLTNEVMIARKLLQLMKLVLGSYQQPEFYCHKITTWLENKSSHEHFIELLNEIEIKCNLPTLLDILDESPHVSVALVNKIYLLEKLQADLEKEVKQLKSQQTFLPSRKNDIYRSSLGFFNDHAHGKKRPTDKPERQRSYSL